MSERSHLDRKKGVRKGADDGTRASVRPDAEAARLLGGLARHSADPAASPDGGVAAGSADLTHALARTLGNRGLSQLSQAGPLIQRVPRARSLTVALTVSETATERYQVTGQTMEEVDAELPANVGEFQHQVVPTWQTAPTEDDDIRVTSVTLPVQYHYLMPEWTALAQQPQRVQDAWQRFYGDVMTHEREHLSVSRTHYNTLRTTLQGLAPADRTESRVQQEIDDGIRAQNAIHASHAGFTTPAAIYFRDYIPEPEPDEDAVAPEAAAEPEDAGE